MVGLPVGYGGVGGQAVGLAASVCLRMTCAALSVVTGRVGQSQLYGVGGILAENAAKRFPGWVTRLKK